MKKTLEFDTENYTVETLEMDGKKLVYRAFEHIPYVLNPVNEEMQRLSIFVPEIFYEGKSIGQYHLKNAPIFLPNTVGGYMPGPVERPGKNVHGETNAAFYALLHGLVVVCPGARGRGNKDEEGSYTGMAPAAVCDLKAAIRYLRHNAEKIPGDVNKIISNGTSAGGALSSLLGSTGSHPDYEAYLDEMGAAKEEDHIFAASCYCPITNLEHADMAYEWEFHGLDEYHRMKFEPPVREGERPQMTPVDGVMSEMQKALSDGLKPMFPAYVNSLGLKDKNGTELTLDESGNGSFKEYVKSYVAESAEAEIRKGSDLSDLEWLTIQDDGKVEIDFEKYVKFRTRMKETPAFDSVEMGTPENELFGTAQIQYRHFTKFSYEHSKVGGELAEEMQVKMMNPMEYIGDERAVKAKHFRIRHGVVDRDTSLAISAMLAAELENHGVDVELKYPWGIAHAGDYDMEELMAWIDDVCGEEEK